VAVHVLGPRHDLLVGERPERVLHHLVVVVEVAGPWRLGQRGEERRVPIGGQERMGVTQGCHVDAPQMLPSGHLGDEVVHHVGGERTGDAGLHIAPGAVVQQRASGLHCGGGVGEVVGQYLVGVGSTGFGEVPHPLVHHGLGQFDDVGSSGQIGVAHGPQDTEG
jgi:hypothetical protein